jgi:dihydrofolate reductase
MSDDAIHSRQETSMRKLIAAALVTLDGVVQDPGGFGETDQGGWAGPYFDDEATRVSLEQLEACEVFLCGRRTYELFSTFWPKGEGPYPDRMNAIPNLVASTTLTEPLSWNARLLDGDVADAIRELKQETGGDIIMYGSPTLLRTLMRHDLVDAYKLSVAPIVLGSGTRLFTDGPDRARLRLVEARPLATGMVMSTYETAR